MDEKREEKVPEQLEKSIVQHEDAVLKTMVQFFAEELLPLWKIEGKVKSLAPIELVHLDITKLYQDSNIVMEDGTWKHFEFQSTNEGVDGLKRFRSYEALASYQNKVEVTTYVLYSGKIKKPITEFTEGVNTYRIIPIIMQNEDVDTFIQELLEKKKDGIIITRAELVRLTLCPLMGGEMSQKDRIKAAYEITKSATSVSREDVRKIEAVLYAMADKFLESMDMDEIMEDVRMTRLGQRLVQDGYDKGYGEGYGEGEGSGAEKNRLENARNLLDVLTEEMIAERIGLPLETVKRLKKEKCKE